MIQDVRFALRQLRKSSAFALTAVGVLGLSIAASTTIFAFVDAALVRPLPYKDPGRLVALFETLPVGNRFHLNWADYEEWKRLNRSFSGLDVYRPDQFRLKTKAHDQIVAGAQVSAGFFRTLGVVPIIGRDFFPGEDQPQAPRTVILSYSLWKTSYAGSPKVLGQTVVLDGSPCVIVGVLPQSFHFAPAPGAGYWRTVAPFLVAAERTGHPFYGIGRLKPGVTLAAAYLDLAPIARRIAATWPQANRDRSVSLVSLPDLILGDIRPTLVALLAGAGLLTLIGLVNVSSLLLVRAVGRRRELALRGALGASRLRLVRQITVEGCVLAGAGLTLGLPSAAAAIALLVSCVPPGLLDDMPYLQYLALSTHTVLFAVLLSLFGVFVFSALPLVEISGSMQSGLSEGSRSGTNRAWRRFGSALVVVELAITVVLLMSAGLLTKSLYRLLHEDVGITTDHLAMVHIASTDDLKPELSIARARTILRAMQALPGAESVGAVQEAPFASGETSKDWFEHFRLLGRIYPGEGDEADMRYISAGYFETLHARLLSGRFLSERDDLAHPRVALINRTMLHQVFAGENPLGKVLIGGWDKDHPVQIVGVVDDIREGALDAGAMPVVYRAFAQNPTDDFYVVLRSALSQPSDGMLRQMVRAAQQVDTNLIVDGEATMTERINDSQAAYLHRFSAWVAAGFAALALLLGSVGLYGVVSFAVGQRTREIGVRMALGAQRGSVYQLVMMEACWLVVLGIAVGTVGSAEASHLLQTMLFATSAWDGATIIGVVSVLSTAALVAAFVPARRAASLNPNEALRAE